MGDLIRYKAGLYIIEFSPPPVGGGKKSKGLEVGKKIKGGKKRKKKFGENITFDSTKL